MRLQSLTLEQFRNYDRFSVEFGEGDLQVFVGENGSGKTNLLEAVSLLALSKSFLPVDDEDLIRWGTTYYRVTGQAVTDAGEPVTLEVISQTEPRKAKACRKNDVRVPVTSFVGQLPVAIFLPQDMSLFSGPPAERRRFLDQILSQVSPDYLQTHLLYQRLLKQRNASLRAISQGTARREDLDPWDQQLSVAGETITRMRLELTETFNLTLADEVRSLGEKWSEVTVAYRDSVRECAPGAPRGDAMRDALAYSLERDLQLQSTTVGPHRDDWTLTADGRSLTTSASRGQQRAAVLALLFLEASYLELRRGERPVILLDDIFSELDDAHQERVVAAFPRHQVLMTSVTLPPTPGTAKLWSVTPGAVTAA